MAMAEKSAAYLEKVARSAVGHTNVRPAESPVPEASHQAGEFGPLPLVIRPAAPAEGKVGRDGRGRGNAERRAIILRWLTGIFLVAGLGWALTSVFAQQPATTKPAAQAPAKAAPAASSKPQQQQSQQQQAQQQPSMPVTTEQALYLIRSTLLTLNDANRSGNYTVLRDLAAPDFQARNTAADLSLSFTDLRRRNFGTIGAATHGRAGVRPAWLPASHRLFSDTTATDQFRFAVSGRRQSVAAVRHCHQHAGCADCHAVIRISRASPRKRGPSPIAGS